MSEKQTIAVIGGTGAEGGGLALRLCNAGYPVIIGSRATAKAERAATEINRRLGTTRASGGALVEAAGLGEIVLLTVPYVAQREAAAQVAGQLAGKILIDATVPLVPPTVGRVQLPDGGSAVANLQVELGDTVRVVAAFQNVSAHRLRALDHKVDCDVLVCGDDGTACDTVIELAGAIGLRGIYAGPICNAAAAEALTSLLIVINRRYKVRGSGVRITGLGSPTAVE